MVGLLDDVEKRCTQDFKQEGDAIILLGDTREELGGSEYLWALHGLVKGQPPELNLDREKALHHVVLGAIRSGLVKSAHDLSEGGLAVALAESCFGQKLGARVALTSEGLRLDVLLFGESQSRVLLSVAPEKLDAVKKLAAEHGVPTRQLGSVGGDLLRISVDGKEEIRLDIGSINEKYREAIACSLK
jgi:phosphoribosylformylglycinamidine synthase